jgi:prepilin-type N-terminal cleavage/methylation domain-containing protein
MRLANRRVGRAQRRGFTLTEVLVVLAIIAVLVSLSVGAVMQTRKVQETGNTKTLITKVDQAFQKRWLATVETARNEPPCAVARNIAGFNTAIYDDRRARVIHIKMRLIQDFPVSFKEATSPVGAASALGGLDANPSYIRAFASATAGARTWQDESSACLYQALKRQVRGTEFDPDTALSSQELVDPVGDGIKEIVDAWKVIGSNRPQPLLFSRFPGFAPSQTAVLVSLGLLPLGDPVDPEKTLCNQTWVSWINTSPQNPALFTQMFGYTPSTTPPNLTPVISSSGYDGKNFTADDIYNFVLSTK